LSGAGRLRIFFCCLLSPLKVRWCVFSEEPLK
jgi:hypothetical protein